MIGMMAMGGYSPFRHTKNLPSVVDDIHRKLKLTC